MVMRNPFAVDGNIKDVLYSNMKGTVPNPNHRLELAKKNCLRWCPRVCVCSFIYFCCGIDRNQYQLRTAPPEMRPQRRPIYTVISWIRRQPPKVKAFLAVVSAMAALVLLRFIVHDHDNLFVAAEAVHSIGISVLIYKLIKEKTCSGLSLKSQDLTAIFLAVRLYCSLVMEYDIHTLLDSATLVATLWVIYMIRFKLKATYMQDKDNFAIYYVLVPCVVLALLVHPSTSHHFLNRILWAFCVYLEAVSVLPQLRVMQNTRIVEPFTAHYVFALGVARFLSCAHWVLQVLDTRGHLLTALGYGLWPSFVLFSEIVQTFILADFCYYYVKSVVGGQLVIRLPAGVV